MREMNPLRPLFLLLGITAVVVAFAASSACRREPAAAAQSVSQKRVATRTVAMPVDGMICQVCAGGAKLALKAVHGVQDVEVSLEKRNAVIRYEEGKVSPDQLARAITDLGLKPGVPTPIQTQ